MKVVSHETKGNKKESSPRDENAEEEGRMKSFAMFLFKENAFGSSDGGHDELGNLNYNSKLLLKMLVVIKV